MSQTIRILMAQINPLVGAITANTQKIIEIIQQKQDEHEVILFPELAICGYPPEDLLLRPDFLQQIQQALHHIQAATKQCHVIVGHPSFDRGKSFNSASIFFNQQGLSTYHKQHLPNYGVFDEKRYFHPGPAKPCIFSVKGYRLGLCICEDLWFEGPVEQLVKKKVDAIVCLNASPFDYEKPQRRIDLLKKHAKRGITIVYVNQVGGQDELVFDGQSMAFNAQGERCAQAPFFKECLESISISKQGIQGTISLPQGQEQLIYNALICGTRDYVEKNGFSGVLLGLSGGIDSALTLSIAVDALGASRVHALMMPSRFTSDMSIEDAQQQLQSLNVAHTTVSIEPLFQHYLETLAPSFRGYKPDVTEENIQARIRGMLLMAFSNKTGKMVLTTSNKSETAVGYATLYGDMAGGLAVLKDLLKTQVYALAHYRNTLSPVIPARVLTRPPSAELAENQTDQDSLPDYAILDAVIKAYMEDNAAVEDIIAAGYRARDVYKIIHLIKQNEYKRRQAAVGIKISPRAFDRDWRLPITSGFNIPRSHQKK